MTAAKMNWEKTMVDNLADILSHKINNRGMSKEQAIREAKQETCAGPKVWETVLSNLNLN